MLQEQPELIGRIEDICGNYMPSQAFLKQISSLKMSKFRQKYGQFVVEGGKSVHEIIHSRYVVECLLATRTFIERNPWASDAEVVSEQEYKKLSAFDTAPGIMAVAKTIHFDISALDLSQPCTLVLDGISDPGNLGTMIRTADWFGIHQVLLSPDSTDFYNPKALSATMGSFTRCRFVYSEIGPFLKSKTAYACVMDGQSLYKTTFKAPCFIVIGSESHGIRNAEVLQHAERITIPGRGGAESLNAAVAAGIVMDHVSRGLGF